MRGEARTLETFLVPGVAGAVGAVGAPKGLGRRHLQVLLLFLAIAMAYGIRINLSVALVSMTNKNREDGYAVRAAPSARPFGTPLPPVDTRRHRGRGSVPG